MRMELKLINFETDEEINLDAKNPVIIGRGKLMGCSDKNVSRNHGQLQLTQDGKVHVVALHENPCFIMKQGLPPVLLLKKGEEKYLDDGDYVGLLINSFWFKIVIVNNTSKTQDISKILKLDDEPTDSYGLKNVKIKINASVSEVRKALEESEKLRQQNESAKINDKPKPDSISVESRKSKTPDIPKKDTESSSSQFPSKSSAVVPDTQSVPVIQSNDQTGNLAEKLKELEPTRRLPLSAYEIPGIPNDVNEIYNPDFFNSKPSISKHSPTVKSPSRESKSENICENSSSSIGMTDSIVNNTANENLTNTENDGDNDDNKQSSSHSEMNQATSDVTQENIETSSSQSNSVRPLCQYGDKCYRKNEEHKRSFSHPGDEDYIPMELRPVCQYDGSCYRRNKNHWVEYRHTQKSPIKVAARNAKAGNKRCKRRRVAQVTYDTDDEEDEEDLEDPFSGDDSDDNFSDELSDYMDDD